MTLPVVLALIFVTTRSVTLGGFLKRSSVQRMCGYLVARTMLTCSRTRVRRGQAGITNSKLKQVSATGSRKGLPNAGKKEMASHPETHLETASESRLSPTNRKNRKPHMTIRVHHLVRLSSTAVIAYRTLCIVHSLKRLDHADARLQRLHKYLYQRWVIIISSLSR
jgi:hypothetical protein